MNPKEVLIDTNFPPLKYYINFEKKNFERSYGIYIVEINHNSEKIFLIDNLNDSLNITTKLPILKFYANMEDTVSARNNRVFKYILSQVTKIKIDDIKKITDKHKVMVEDYLYNSTLKMFVYPLIKFNFEELTKKIHKENNQNVRDFESQVIRLFHKANKKLINEIIDLEYVRYEDVLFPKVWEQIKNDFYV